MERQSEYDKMKEITHSLDIEHSDQLDLTNLDLIVDVSDIDLVPNETFALLRKNGFGCSDSSKLLSVNKFGTKAELIAEKSRNYLTEEDRAIGEKASVKAGNDLEPFIISKSQEILQRRVIKPTDQYRHTEFPFLTANFDGVIENISLDGVVYKYIPNEIKLATPFGTKQYDLTKCFHKQSTGFTNIPPNYGDTKTNDYYQVASQYGIPVYYYTQMQMEMYHLKAPFGLLTVLVEKNWEVCTWFIWADPRVQSQVIVEGSKAWNYVAAARNLEFEDGLIKGVGVTDGKHISQNMPQNNVKHGLDNSNPRLVPQQKVVETDDKLDEIEAERIINEGGDIPSSDGTR